MTLKFYVGLGSFSLSLFSIFLNLLIFPPVFRLAFIEKKSSVYIIAFFNIISDLLQLLVTCFYLSASIMADEYVITGERMNTLAVIFGWIFINAWYMECLVQIVMAANRFCIITLKQYHIFTFNFTMAVFAVLIAITSFSAVCTQYLFPCCVFISDKDIMSFMFENPRQEYSYSNLMLVSYDIFCTSTSTVCYISVFFSIRNSYKDAAISGQSEQNKRGGNKDVKYLLQFVFISIFYIFTWVLFELLPHIVPAEHPEWFSVVPVLVTLNCSSNSVIYLSCNREVRKSIRFSWRNSVSSRTSRVSTAVTTNGGQSSAVAAVDN